MEHNNLIKYILGLSNNYNYKEFKYNMELIKTLLYNMIEDMTFCKIYNKDKVFEEIKQFYANNINESNIFILDNISMMIIKNILLNISYKQIFKNESLLGNDLSLIFINNKANVLYKNKTINIEYFKHDVINRNLIAIPDIFFDTVITIIEKFINMDLSVKYMCSDIPPPIWSLFEKLSYRNNINAYNNLIEYEYIHNINNKINCEEHIIDIDPEIIEELVTIKDDLIINDEIDNEIQDGISYDLEQINNYDITINKLTQKKNDFLYRMEIVMFLETDETVYFLEALKSLDQYILPLDNSHSITGYILAMLDHMDKYDNIFYKFYFAIKILKYSLTIKYYMINNENMMNVMSDLLDSICNNYDKIKNLGLLFESEIISTMVKSHDFIDDIKNH
jgi:hypothetical protein